jgi:hypothetical protein
MVYANHNSKIGGKGLCRAVRRGMDEPQRAQRPSRDVGKMRLAFNHNSPRTSPGFSARRLVRPDGPARRRSGAYVGPPAAMIGGHGGR